MQGTIHWCVLRGLFHLHFEKACSPVHFCECELPHPISFTLTAS